jgi:hypothetical protein
MGTAESTLRSNYGITSKTWENARQTNDYLVADGIAKDTGELVTIFLHLKKSDSLFNAIAKGIKVFVVNSRR